MTNPIRDRVIEWYKAGLAAVDPAVVTRAALEDFDPGTGKLVVIAIGKAAVPMASAAQDVLAKRIDAGLLVTKNLTEDVEGFTCLEAAHPVPDENSLRAGELALDLVQDLTEDDTVLALISGGGSSLIEAPIEGVSLMDMQVVAQLLMHAGAGIYDLNAVRTALSGIKGGGLRRAIGDARCVTMMISDVVGDDHTVIASGPTIPAPTSRNRAWSVIEEYRLERNVPENVRIALSSDAPPAETPDVSCDIRTVIASNELFISEIARQAKRDGLNLEVAWERWQGSATDLAERILEDSAGAEPSVDVLLGGGEATTVVHQSGGKGGRNTEVALRLALENVGGWTFASLASDGDDGNSGAAGAIVDSRTIPDDAGEEARAQAALKASDSAGYLADSGSLLITGSTGTNVNDVYIAVRNTAIAGENS